MRAPVEERIHRLEVDVVNLRVQNAEFNGALANLKDAVNELRDVVQELRDTMNKGRGAIWLFGLGAAGLGGLASTIIKKLMGS